MWKRFVCSQKVLHKCKALLLYWMNVYLGKVLSKCLPHARPAPHQEIGLKSWDVQQPMAGSFSACLWSLVGCKPLDACKRTRSATLPVLCHLALERQEGTVAVRMGRLWIASPDPQVRITAQVSASLSDPRDWGVCGLPVPTPWGKLLECACFVAGRGGGSQGEGGGGREGGADCHAGHVCKAAGLFLFCDPNRGAGRGEGTLRPPAPKKM